MAAANRQAVLDAEGSTSRRGFARGTVIPGRSGKCAYGRSPMAETFIGRTRAGRDTRIGVQREVPRGYTAVAISAADRRLGLVIRVLHWIGEARSAWLLKGCGLSFERALRIGEPQDRQDSAAIPHQSGDWISDRFIPASFACWDRRQCGRAAFI
jgi:hypothetical protein